VVRHTSIRVLLAIVAHQDLELEQLDVKTAFLNGELEEEIYMTQPDGFQVPGKEDYVCKLKRSLYGLNSHRGSGTRGLTVICWRLATIGVRMILVSTTTR